MFEIIRNNRRYFAFYWCFFMLLFWYQLRFYQSDAIFFFSEHRSAFGNLFFYWWTTMGEEFAFIFVALICVYKDKRKMALEVAITGIIVLVLSQILKHFFDHDRPVNVFEKSGIFSKINFVNGYILRGDRSFPSGHTTAAFALYSIVAFHFSKYKNVQLLLLLAAILVGVSRVYLVAHFPEDVLFGSFVGCVIALFVHYFYEKYALKYVGKKEIA